MKYDTLKLRECFSLFLVFYILHIHILYLIHVAQQSYEVGFAELLSK